MSIHYATINEQGNIIETFLTDDPDKVQPREDYHQIIRIDPSQPSNPITHRYNSLYDLLNIPF